MICENIGKYFHECDGGPQIKEEYQNNFDILKENI